MLSIRLGNKDPWRFCTCETSADHGQTRLASQRLANIEPAPNPTQATAAPGKYLLDKEWEQSRCLQDHGQAEEDAPPVGHTVASKATRW